MDEEKQNKEEFRDKRIIHILYGAVMACLISIGIIGKIAGEDQAMIVFPALYLPMGLLAIFLGLRSCKHERAKEKEDVGITVRSKRPSDFYASLFIYFGVGAIIVFFVEIFSYFSG